jgi:chemotaxis receptor (MCP) glutamine deamidase CheD
MANPTREVTVASDRFEVVDDDAVLVTELTSAIGVCLYDAVQEAGALLHLKCVVPPTRGHDITETTLATELLLLDRCVESMRETAPSARNLQARIVVHLAEHPHAHEVCDTVLTLARQFLADTGVRLLPIDMGSGAPRQVRFRPSMGWVQVH